MAFFIHRGEFAVSMEGMNKWEKGGIKEKEVVNQHRPLWSFF
jgi:hypothetical protein